MNPSVTFHTLPWSGSWDGSTRDFFLYPLDSHPFSIPFVVHLWHCELPFFFHFGKPIGPENLRKKLCCVSRFCTKSKGCSCCNTGLHEIPPFHLTSPNKPGVYNVFSTCFSCSPGFGFLFMDGRSQAIFTPALESMSWEVFVCVLICLCSSKVDGNPMGIFPEKTWYVWFCLVFNVGRNSQNDKDFREGSRSFLEFGCIIMIIINIKNTIITIIQSASPRRLENRKIQDVCFFWFDFYWQSKNGLLFESGSTISLICIEIKQTFTTYDGLSLLPAIHDFAECNKHCAHKLEWNISNWWRKYTFIRMKVLKVQLSVCTPGNATFDQWPKKVGLCSWNSFLQKS